MVASGTASSLSTKIVEIIDLEISSSSCQNLEEFPRRLDGMNGGALQGGSPLLCGGGNDMEEFDQCYGFGQNGWQAFPSLTEPKRWMKTTKSPFIREDFDLIMVGGSRLSDFQSLDTSEVLTIDGWRSDVLPRLPEAMSSHCVLSRDSRTLMVNGVTKTYLMSDDLIWTEGPPPAIVNSGFYCGRILKSAESYELSVVSVGIGYYTDIVEVLDTGSSEWRSGPSLPFIVKSSAMVEDPYGGVIVIGGKGPNGNLLLNSTQTYLIYFWRPINQFVTVILIVLYFPESIF